MSTEERKKHTVCMSDLSADIAMNLHDADEEQILQIVRILNPGNDYEIVDYDTVPVTVEVTYD